MSRLFLQTFVIGWMLYVGGESEAKTVDNDRIILFSPFRCDDWGFVVAGTELSEIQRQIDNLPTKTDPEAVGQLLCLRRDVLFLEFDVAVRHSVCDTFLATGNIHAYKVLSVI